MIVTTTKINAMVLVFAMDVSSKSIRDYLKQENGSIKARGIMKIYKSVIKKMEKHLFNYKDEQEDDLVDIELTNDEMIVAKDFIDAYVSKAKDDCIWKEPLSSMLDALMIAELEIA